MIERHFPNIVISYIGLCLVLGGASAAGVLANLLLQLIALPLIIFSISRLKNANFDPQHRRSLTLLGFVLLLPVLQLVPLPPSLWSQLPGRLPVFDDMNSLAINPPALGISLVPWRTVASAVWMLVPSAAFLSVLSVDAVTRRRIGWTVLAVSAVSVPISFLQYTSVKWFYFYNITNYGSPVGFFANRNHLATLLLCAIPTLTIMLPSASLDPVAAHARLSQSVILAASVLVILLLIVLTGSRAGMGLSLPTIALSYALTLRSRTGISPWPTLITAALIGLVVIIAVIYGPYFGRVVEKSANAGDDVRLVAGPIALLLGWKFFPFGTGFGTFDPVFRWQANGASLDANFVNHAHDDFLELWMTGGLPAMLLLAWFAIWFYRAARANWTTRAVNLGGMARVATVGIIIMLLHSIVDYPLRTAGMAALFAAFCAMQLTPILPGAPRKSSRTKIGFRVNTSRPVIQAPIRIGDQLTRALPKESNRFEKS